MSTNKPQPKKDDFGKNILEFFLGTPKRVGRTFIFIGIIVTIIYIDEIINAVQRALCSILNLAVSLINQLLPSILVIAILIVIIKGILSGLKK
jgi:hypothetical protein